MIVAVTRSRTVVAALCVVSVLALGACSGDDPQPRFAPPSSSAPTSPSTTAVSGPVEPTMPAAARGSDAAAAEAFVRFYWEMVNYAEQTGDLVGLKRIARSECAACTRGIGYLQDVFAADGEITGGIQTVSHARTTFAADNGVHEATVEFKLTSTRQRVDYPGPAKDKIFEPGTVRLRAVLVLSTDDEWRMVYWGER
ncbi:MULTISPECIES: DUF6318 family protein [unclassified Nocardioides]|uniref:DUF6318 family protein n=1 Tax=unclassified Nocardioides TaxID=2615069 RepID=UPI000056FDBC|nr:MULTISPECIES: DUF6318 family protein [unclassified Nocardioides]ABL81024.1 hypothetical protein Noca_1510 [Nocardioides sp. JS614]